MILFDAEWAPNPRRVRMVIAEKRLAERGVAIERRTVDLRGGENLRPDYLAVNPRGLVPALRLEDGTLLDDSVAIARYLDALYPDPPLFGADPVGIAVVEGWTRRIESDGYAPAADVLRNTLPAFAGRGVPGHGPPVAQIAALAERGRGMWAGFVAALDAHLAGRRWIAGDRFSFADITALVTIDFARAGRLTVPAEARAIARWLAEMRRRPSAVA